MSKERIDHFHTFISVTSAFYPDLGAYSSEHLGNAESRATPTVQKRRDPLGRWGIIGLVLAAIHAACGHPVADLVITNARLFEGTGAVVERATIVVVGERIASVAGDGVPPRARRVFDARGKTVLPGLIDTHVHLLISYGPSVASDSALEQWTRERLPGRLGTLIEDGVTSVMSAGDYWPAILDVRARLSSGELRGPRLFVSGPVFTAPNGHPAVTVCRTGDSINAWCRARLAVEVDEPDSARSAVRQVAGSGVDAIKLVYDDFGDPTLGKLTPETLRAIVDEAHANGLEVLAHVGQDPKDVIDALEWGVDRLAHAPQTADALSGQRLVTALRDHGGSVAGTLAPGHRWIEMARDQGRDGVADRIAGMQDGALRTVRTVAEEAPELIAVGTDAPMAPFGDALPREIRALAELGLDPRLVLLAATRNAAAHIGQLDDLGTVEPGKLADLIVVDGNPLEDLSRLSNVELVISGRSSNPARRIGA